MLCDKTEIYKPFKKILKSKKSGISADSNTQKYIIKVQEFKNTLKVQNTKRKG